MFEGRYLRQTPDITKEVYEEIYNALIADGYKDYDKSFVDSWEFFSGDNSYKYLSDYTNQCIRKIRTICTTSTPYGEEISLSELLCLVRKSEPSRKVCDYITQAHIRNDASLITENIGLSVDTIISKGTSNVSCFMRNIGDFTTGACYKLSCSKCKFELNGNLNLEDARQRAVSWLRETNTIKQKPYTQEYTAVQVNKDIFFPKVEEIL
jgi:hypothetical protein